MSSQDKIVPTSILDTNPELLLNPVNIHPATSPQPTAFTYCGDKRGIEGVFRESEQDTSLSDAGIADQQQFEKVIVGFGHFSFDDNIPTKSSPIIQTPDLLHDRMSAEETPKEYNFDSHVEYVPSVIQQLIYLP